MNYVIIPNQGVDDLRFGMTPAQVRAIAGDDFVPFSGRAESKEFPIDHYSGWGMYCSYDPTGILNAIEFAKPARPTLDGVDIMPMTLTEAQAFIRSLGGRVKVAWDGATAYDVGVGVWSSQEYDEPIESVIVFRPGYYDQYLAGWTV